jgi:hypothetical protein
MTLNDGSILGVALGGPRYGGLLRAWHDGRCQSFNWASRPHRMIAGPGDAVVIIDASQDNCFHIWWMATDMVSAVSFDAFGLDEDPQLVYYDRHRDYLIVVATSIHVAKWQWPATLPRHNRM